MHDARRSDSQLSSPTTLVFDEVLDADAAKRMRRFERRARQTSRSDASIDLRRTRSVASNAWGTLVKAIRDLSAGGHTVTIIAGERLRGLLQVTDLVRFAHVIIV
jgi:ABC-type transporter Mla MlaB component